MTLMNRIMKTLEAIEGDGVLVVDGLHSTDQYYNGEIIKEALSEVIPEEIVDIKLPGDISDRIFKAEQLGISLVEFVHMLRAEGERTEGGRWFQVEQNQIKLLLGWIFGYTVEVEAEKFPLILPSKDRNGYAFVKSDGNIAWTANRSLVPELTREEIRAVDPKYLVFIGDDEDEI